MPRIHRANLNVGSEEVLEGRTEKGYGLRQWQDVASVYVCELSVGIDRNRRLHDVDACLTADRGPSLEI